MSSVGSTGSGKRGDDSQDFELNIASIIDCFTVLIAFMLASASFLAIGILDAGVAAAGATANTTKPPSVNLTLQLMPDHKIQLKLNGKANRTNMLAGVSGDWDLAGLTKGLNGLKAQYPDLNAITLTADNTIEYKDVIKTMDTVRKSIPAVLLGGF